MVTGPLILRFQVTPFVILFVERAGSTYLVTALKAHPRVLALTEKLDSMRQEGRGPQEQLRWVDALLTPPLLGRHRAIGFKTKMVDVLDLPGFAQLLKRHRCKIIQLRRRNTIKSVVSTLNARRQWEASGNWNLLSESTRLPPFKVEPVNLDRLVVERERLDSELESYVEALHLPTLRLFYEDLLASPLTFVHQTVDFLGVDRHPVSGTTLKNTDDNLREAILNFDELRSRYLGTRYEAMFDEVLAAASTGVR
jgi:LPS sulfotransferase NodH